MDADKPSTEFISTVIKTETNAQTTPPVISDRDRREIRYRRWEKIRDRFLTEQRKYLIKGFINKATYDQDIEYFLKGNDCCPKCGYARIANVRWGMQRPVPCACQDGLKLPAPW